MYKHISIDEVVHLIESNSSQKLGYKELCKQTNLSVRQLIDLFKVKNTTPMMFIRSVEKKSQIEKNSDVKKYIYINSIKKF
jgi:transcriptional regulator GlxA family with amidase domain